jgi:MFS family permease
MFAALFAALAAAWLTRPFLPILIARFAELRLYDATAAVGVVLSAVGTAQAVSSPIWGRVIDRYGQVRVLMLTTLAGAGALLFAGFASGLYSLAAWLLVYGCVAAALSTGTMALLARTVTPERRGAVLGQIYFPFYVSGLVGPPAGAFLFVHGQLPLFAAAAGPTLVPFALLLSRWRSAA